MTVFVDTSAFISLLIPEDQNHAAAACVWRDLVTRDEHLVTTSYAVVETCAILQRRFGSTAVRKLVDGVLPVVAIEFIDAELHNVGLAAALLSARRGPSIVDCVSIATMRKLGITSAFAFDPHFSEPGFAVFPQSPSAAD